MIFCIHLWIPYTSTMMSYSSRVMYNVIKYKLPRFCLRCILETSNKWCCHHICITGAYPSTLDMLEKFIHMQDPTSTNIRELRTAIKMAWLKIILEIWPVVESMTNWVTALCQVEEIDSDTRHHFNNFCHINVSLELKWYIIYSQIILNKSSHVKMLLKKTSCH